MPPAKDTTLTLAVGELQIAQRRSHVVIRLVRLRPFGDQDPCPAALGAVADSSHAGSQEAPLTTAQVVRDESLRRRCLTTHHRPERHGEALTRPCQTGHQGALFQ